MNIVSPSLIRDYLLEKFEQDSQVTSYGEELVIPSVFVPNDYKKHMSINLNTGLWQCFKTGNKGNIFSLYSYLEGVSYSNAESHFLFKEFTQLSNHLEKKKPAFSYIKVEEDRKELLDFEPVTVGSFDSKDHLILRAWTFLYERKLFDTENEEWPRFYICREGKYKDRLIIPYEDSEGHVFFFQARSLIGATPKYLNPPSMYWPKSSNILYPYDEAGDHLVVCEGPLDAISLKLQGVNATCTAGSYMSGVQIEQLSEFDGRIIIGFDNDEAGHKGIKSVEELGKNKRMANFFVCHPPLEVKDWNDAHIKDIGLRSYVEDNSSELTFEYKIAHLLTSL